MTPSKLDGVVLYADLAESTAVVNAHAAAFAAEVYKTYLHCAAKVIQSNGGVIASYDGDRVMGVFIGDTKRTAAAKAALQINYAVTQIINPELHAFCTNSTFELKQAVGIDTSSLYVARTGVRGANDLVWVGRSANYAAKLCSLRQGNFASFITADVYSQLNDRAKFGGLQNESMWQTFYWSGMGITVYRSTWWWTV